MARLLDRLFSLCAGRALSDRLEQHRIRKWAEECDKTSTAHIITPLLGTLPQQTTNSDDAMGTNPSPQAAALTAQSACHPAQATTTLHLSQSVELEPTRSNFVDPSTLAAVAPDLASPPPSAPGPLLFRAPPMPEMIGIGKFRRAKTATEEWTRNNYHAHTSVLGTWVKDTLIRSETLPQWERDTLERKDSGVCVSPSGETGTQNVEIDSENGSMTVRGFMSQGSSLVSTPIRTSIITRPRRLSLLSIASRNRTIVDDINALVVSPQELNTKLASAIGSPASIVSFPLSNSPFLPAPGAGQAVQKKRTRLELLVNLRALFQSGCYEDVFEKDSPPTASAAIGMEIVKYMAEPEVTPAQAVPVTIKLRADTSNTGNMAVPPARRVRPTVKVVGQRKSQHVRKSATRPSRTVAHARNKSEESNRSKKTGVATKTCVAAHKSALQQTKPIVAGLADRRRRITWVDGLNDEKGITSDKSEEGRVTHLEDVVGKGELICT